MPQPNPDGGIMKDKIYKNTFWFIMGVAICLSVAVPYHYSNNRDTGKQIESLSSEIRAKDSMYARCMNRMVVWQQYARDKQYQPEREMKRLRPER
jgi:hypothetical protein